MKTFISGLFGAVLLLCSNAILAALVVPTDIQQPGTQPQEIGNLESPDKCDNCHGGYNSSVEPAHNWRGSMMAHAGRDPIFWATVAIAEQDFDGSGDLCIRCHSTGGWLAGRSTPTDGSGLAAGDSDGVECDFCHKMTNPDNSEHFGVMHGSFIANEPEPNNDAIFDWDPPGGDGIEGYLGSGMASMWGGSDKLGPYNDAEARHQFMQSKFHRDRDFCGSCHDVSNPAVGDLAHNNGAQVPLAPGTFSGVPGADVDGKAAFNNPPYKYGIVERTFSEYKAGQISRTLISPYGDLTDDTYLDLPAELQGGALEAMYNAATQNGTIDGHYQNPAAPRYFSCQTCHMRPVTGEGANKNGVPVRVDLPLHDMTGGNYWMPEAIAYLDSMNKLRLGGGMTQGQVDAMLDGALRAKEQLNLAASLTLTGNPGNVRIVNHTGHKLISGYPEGRRMWFNIKWYDSAGVVIREDGEYGPLDLQMDLDGDGQNDTVNTILDLEGTNTEIYEAHMGMTQEWAIQLINLGYPANLPLSYDRVTGDVDCELGNLAQTDGTETLPPCDGDPAYHETFHFVLNNTVVKDNRIPPYNMSYDIAEIRNALPVPPDQYGGAPGGTYDYFDEVDLNPPATAASAVISLMYQPTSWEYIQFLYLANNKSNAFLANEGDNMLDAWLNAGEPDPDVPADEDLRMAAPYVMASVTWGTPPGECNATIPTLLSAVPGHEQVSLNWQEIPGDPDVTGYKLYYDQAGKAQLVADLPCPPDSMVPCTSHTDTGLTNGQTYYYKVTSYSGSCESDFSNILSATPTQPGQEVNVSVVDPLQTGRYVTTGKGKDKVTTFEPTGTLFQGDGVVIRATVLDEGGVPLPDATVVIAITGNETVELTTGPSNAEGIAEATWQTEAPNRKGQGGTATGGYTATTTGVTATGFVWDEIQADVNFSINQP